MEREANNFVHPEIIFCKIVVFGGGYFLFYICIYDCFSYGRKGSYFVSKRMFK